MSGRSKISVVTERGRVSIPVHLRKEMSLSHGQRLLWERISEREICVTVIAKPTTGGAMKMLGFAKRFRPTRTTQEWMDELR